MKNKKKAIVLIYVLFLVTISVVFASILLNNNSYLFNITDFFETDSKLYTNIDSDAQISIDINNEVNSNGSGFVDIISCPSGNTVSMSGTTTADHNMKVDILTNSGGSIYCEGTYQSKPVRVYFNTGFTDFDQAQYDIYYVGMTAGVGDTTFGDGDATLIDISGSAYNNPDGIDDDFNSDNYMVTSTGNTSTGTYFPNPFQDDDNSARKQLFGYVTLDFGYKKVFWNTSKVLKMIDDNTNNNDFLNEKISNVGTGVLHFDIDKDADIRVVKFDKTVYDDTGELIRLENLTGALSASIGYLQDNSGVLSLSGAITGNEYIFDFINNDYAVFLKGTSTGTLLYNITGETTNGTGIYINPIDDSDASIVRYLGNEILIDDKGRFISKESELIFKK